VVWTRRHVWAWRGTVYDSRESFALVRVSDVRAVRPTSHDALFVGPDAREEHRWWTLEELERDRAQRAPTRLAELLSDLLREGPPQRPIDTGR
jgi:hypothetical protein